MRCDSPDAELKERCPTCGERVASFFEHVDRDGIDETTGFCKPNPEEKLTMTRDEHLKWCKDRAHEIVNGGDTTGAIASMCSDIQKHDGTRLEGSTLGVLMLAAGMDAQSPELIRRWIDGFN